MTLCMCSALVLSALLLGAEPTLSMDQAVALALSANPGLRRAAAAREAASAEADLARPRLRPDLALEAGGELRDSPVRDPAAPNALVRRGLEGRLELTAEQPLLAFGVGSLRDRAAAVETAAQADWRAATSKVRHEVRLAWLDLLAARAGQALAAEGARQAEAQLQHVADLAAVQRVAEVDRLQAQAGLLEAQAAQVEAAAGVAVANANLNRLLGAADLDTPRVPAPSETLPPTPGEPAALVVRAQAQRPEIAALAARQREAEASARFLAARRLPTLAATASATLQTPTAFEPSAEARVGVVMRWPLSRADNEHARQRAAALAGAAQARLALDELRAGIAVEVRRAWHDDDAARRKLELATARVAAAAEAARVRALQYERQRATLLEVQQARLAQQRAELDQVTARVAVQRAAAALELAVGQ